MKTIVIILALLATSIGVASAQHVNPDTISMNGLRLDMRRADIGLCVHSEVDTLINGGPHGASVYSIPATYFGEKGEFRLAIDELGVTQITFVVNVRDTADRSVRLAALSSKMIKKFGKPDAEYPSPYYMLFWKGQKQELALKSNDGSVYLTVSLSKPERPATGAPLAKRPTIKFKTK